MDQYASIMSKSGHVILLDCQSLEHEYVPINIEPYKVLLLNTNVSHNLASSEYNTRRQECEKGVSIIQKKYHGINSLRDVDKNLLSEFKRVMPHTIFSRCKYVIDEKIRVLDAVQALKENKLKVFGNLIYATHQGLSTEYEVSCAELDFLVEFSKRFDTIIGSRMMGGGFGGCTINIIHQDAILDFIEKVSKAYFIKFNINLDALDINPIGGTSIIKNN